VASRASFNSCSCLFRAQAPERGAQVVLGLGPLERHALAGAFLQGGAEGLDRLLEPGWIALSLAQGPKRDAQVGLGPGPLQRHALARQFNKGLSVKIDGLQESCVIALLNTVSLERSSIRILA
jgi:hypothetical protein